MTYTAGLTCKCGATLGVNAWAHPFAWRSLMHSFEEIHTYCVTQPSNDVNEDPGGDVFTQAERAPRHSEPELVTGFQREVFW